MQSDAPQGGNAVSPQTPSAPATTPPRRWYRIYQVTDISYYVRRDTGPTDKADMLDGCQEFVELPRQMSAPSYWERYLGLAEAQGFQRDAFNNDCRVCFERPAEVVALPCRHGGMCEACFRRTIFSRPAHRGGRNCPFCRRRIREAVLLYRPGPVARLGGGCTQAVQWAYSVELDWPNRGGSTAPT
jgi:hypothetical protein